MHKLLATLATLALALTVHVATPPPPAQAAMVHQIVHLALSDRSTILVADAGGNIYYLQPYRTQVAVKFFIPFGCQGYERHFVLGYPRITHRFGTGPRWGVISGHTHSSWRGTMTHQVDVQC